MSLKASSWISLALFACLIGLLLFLSAGTMRYWQAWLFLTTIVSASSLITLDLQRRDPALLRRRMTGPNAESRPAQKTIMRLGWLIFASVFVVSALDHRFRWSVDSARIAPFGDALVILGYYFIYRVYRENTFTSATIQVVSDQTVVSTGPYAIVRHPMYASAMLYLLGTPLALGSWWGLFGIALMLPFLIWRLLDEERLLEDQLLGYREYQSRVRCRLIPRVW